VRGGAGKPTWKNTPEKRENTVHKKKASQQQAGGKKTDPRGGSKRTLWHNVTPCRNREKVLRPRKCPNKKNKTRTPSPDRKTKKAGSPSSTATRRRYKSGDVCKGNGTGLKNPSTKKRGRALKEQHGRTNWKQKPEKNKLQFIESTKVALTFK